MRHVVLAAALAASAFALTACNTGSSSSPDGSATRFTVTLRSAPGGPSPLAPGVFVVHAGGTPIFQAGTPAGRGLEALAEDGDPSHVMVAGGEVFNTPVGDAGPGPATPGKEFRISFEASPGDRLSFATMYGQSNDCFYAPADTGLPLFAGGAPVAGDVTSQVYLWDAGTERNEPPGIGPNQAPRQPAPDTGIPESVGVSPVAQRDGYDYGQAIQVIVEPQ